MTDALERARAGVKRLKVFPLPSVVLLPGAAAPLHIFEPRYRQMVEHALAGDGLFALAQVMPGQESLVAGAPALEEMLCVGSITLHEKLDDGRHNLVLVGVARARLLREHQSAALYREVEAELIEDPPPAPGVEDGLRQAVVELVARLPVEVGERVAQISARVGGGLLADVLASTFMDEPSLRFEVLNEVDIAKRLELVTEELLGLVAQLKPRKPEGLMN